MKKVISALTAATMVASMSASVMSAFAVYQESDITFYLKANPNSYYTTEGKQQQTAKFTVSEDGKTVTFASAADAAGAKLGIGAYIAMPTENPTIQQVLGMVKTNSDKIHFGVGNANLMAKVDGDEALTYTAAGGKEFSCDCFVNTFAVYKRNKYDCNTMVMTQEDIGASSLREGVSGFTWNWAPKLSTTVTTASFLGDTSDAFPLTEFTIALDDAITDGTYTIEYDDTLINEYGENPFCFVSDGENQVKPGTMEGLTIVVGDEQPTEEQPSEEQPTEEQPTEEQPTEEQPTEEKPTEEQPTEGPVAIEGYTWKVDDVIFENPDASNEDSYVDLPVLVYNDPGTYGTQFRLLIDGKTFDDPDCPFICDGISNGGGYSRVQAVVPNTATAFVSLAIQGTETLGDDQCKDGEAALVFTILPKEGVEYVPGTKYKVTIDTTSNEEYWPVFSNEAKEDLMPSLTLAAGSITIPGGEEPSEEQPSEEKPSEEQPSEEKPSEEQPSEEKPSEEQPTEEPQPVGDYVYGDVNKNGKVELVDIVMLNRFLTKYDNQALDAYQVEVANCAGNAAPGEGKSTEADLNGDDSIEILKYLIGLVASLPSKG